MSDIPYVSIITPCYNCEKYLKETIDSVINQTFKDWEMIIVDDCSTDSSYKIALDAAKLDPRILVYKNEQNKGACFSRNFATDKAKGKFLAFLDSDDIWYAEKLKDQLDFMQQNDCDFSFTEYELIDSDSKPLHKKARVINRLNYRKNLFHNFPGCLTVIYDREKIGCVHGNKTGNADDYDLFLNVLKNASNAMGIKKILARYRKHSDSISYNRFGMIKEHFMVLHKLHKIPAVLAAFYLFTHIVIIYFYKTRTIKA